MIQEAREAWLSDYSRAVRGAMAGGASYCEHVAHLIAAFHSALARCSIDALVPNAGGYLDDIEADTVPSYLSRDPGQFAWRWCDGFDALCSPAALGRCLRMPGGVSLAAYGGLVCAVRENALRRLPISSRLDFYCAIYVAEWNRSQRVDAVAMSMVPIVQAVLADRDVIAEPEDSLFLCLVLGVLGEPHLSVYARTVAYCNDLIRTGKLGEHTEFLRPGEWCLLAQRCPELSMYEPNVD